MDGDSLRSVRNSFYLGLYPDVTKEVQSLEQGNKELQMWGDIYIARSQTALNPASLQINSNASTALQAVKQLATYFTTEDDHKDMILDTLRDWLGTADLRADVTLQLIASQIYYVHGDLKDSLALVVNDAENLEKLAMCVLIYLRLDRPDLAAKCYKAMQDLDDDDTLTQLAGAWLNIANGTSEKITEATFLLQDLMEKFKPSVTVLNSLAVCEIHQKNYTNAFQLLKQARELSITSNQKVSAETLLNSIVCLQHLRKGQDIIEKITAELKQNYPNHPYVLKQQEMEQLFDKYAAGYKAGKK